MSPNPKLIDKWLASLPRQHRTALSAIIATADASGTPLYLVGGPLRDLLLHISPSLDIDLIAEGDAIELAQRVAPSLEAGVKTHSTFRTATILLPSPSERGVGGEGRTPRPARPEVLVGRAGYGHHGPSSTFTIDIATARTETYARPGALPKTTPATIEQDLLRRDFTINALALRLNGPGRGARTGVRPDELLDPTGGLADLDARLIRVLHIRSFQDDPTRILRAARYAVRLGFRIERRTLTRLKRDTKYLQNVSGTRLHHEFSRILAEPAPETILRHLDHLGVLTAIHPSLRFERPEATTFRRLRVLTSNVGQGFTPNVGQGFTPPGATTPASENQEPPQIAAQGLSKSRQGDTLTPGATAACWPALALRLSPSDATSLATRLALTNPQRAAVEAMPRLRAKLSTFNLQLSTSSCSAITGLLAPFPLPALWACAAASTGRPRTRILDYLTTARHIHPILRGDDLIALGVPQGPAVGDILRRLRAAKLDGEVKTRTDEIRLVQAINITGDLEGGDAVGRQVRLRGKRVGGSRARPRTTPQPAHPEPSPPRRESKE